MKCSYSALLTDFYELTMMQGFFHQEPERRAVFDMFFRRNPFEGGYAIFAGLKPMLEALEEFHFYPEDIEYLRSLNHFSDDFLDYLQSFRFTGDIYAVREGSVVFPDEPLIRIEGTLLETQLIEPLLLNIVNFQTLIATKTARVCESAKGKAVMEFGLRRSQGTDGAVSASRAAYIGGAAATSNVLAGRLYDIPVRGTMAHSWVMSFKTEMDAFEKFAEIYPDDAILLVDTYDTLKSGVPNAIKIFKKLKEQGHKNFGIRLDSGDLAFLSREAKKMFRQAGLEEAKIIVSNELDEWVMTQLAHEGAEIDAFGVGTRMVTGGNDPALSGVYKLALKEENKKFVPSMKMTNNPAKMNNPGLKNAMRFYDKEGLMLADLVYLESSKKKIDALVSAGEEIRLNHPSIEYSYTILDDYQTQEVLLSKVMEDGVILGGLNSIHEAQAKAKEDLGRLHSSYKRLLNPHVYKVSVSNQLKKMKMDFIRKQSV